MAKVCADSESGILGLKSRRQRQGISLDDIVRETKISLRSLQAIENGDFSKLPGGVYATNYIRQYARMIGFDEEQLLKSYYVQTGTAPLSKIGADGQFGTSERKPISRFFRLPFVAAGSQ